MGSVKLGISGPHRLFYLLSFTTLALNLICFRIERRRGYLKCLTCFLKQHDRSSISSTAKTILWVWNQFMERVDDA